MNRKMVVVGVDDGIILDLSRCVILDEATLGEADRELLNFGTDTDALSVANRLGESLIGILEGCGYGDLNYFNCIALSPTALREEFAELPSLFPENLENADHLREILEWGTKLNDEQLDFLSAYILQDDALWSQWRSSVVASLYEFYHNQHPHTHEEEKS